MRHQRHLIELVISVILLEEEGIEAYNSSNLIRRGGHIELDLLEQYV